LASLVGGEVVALQPDGCDQPAASARLESVESLGALGADEVVVLVGASAAEDVARGVGSWAADHRPWAVLAPSTAFGREVAGRAAAALGAGLVGDAIEVDVVGGRLVAAKPAFSGALMADITCTSPVQMVTIRPGVLPVTPPRRHEARMSRRKVVAGSRVRVLSRYRDDDVEVLARAEVVIGVGTGVLPEEYSSLSALAAILGAELAATRKATDKGWAPHSRQVGITGRSIAPRLYVALGLSGKFNHMVGVRAAGTVIAVNADRAAPVFAHADVGIVGDWHDVVPMLEDALRSLLRPGGRR
jgi:electron transfer flavoprotein alpha subunit